MQVRDEVESKGFRERNKAGETYRIGAAEAVEFDVEGRISPVDAGVSSIASW